MKIRTKLSFMVLTASAIATWSCSKSFLEITPTTEVSTTEAITDVASMRTAIAGTYAQMKDFNYYGRTTMLVPELLSDNAFISTRNTGRYISYGDYAIVPEEAFSRDQWRQQYITAANASMIIQYGEPLNISESELDERNQIIGEAYAVRALAYFDLLKMYAQPYSYTADASHPGVPIVRELPTQLSELVYPGRSTVKEGYDWVVENLQHAIAIMPPRLIVQGRVSSSKTRLSLNGAKALLARVYLYMGKYQLAADLATEVIESQQYSLLVTNSLIAGFKSLNSSESIFEIANNQSDHQGSNSLAAMFHQSNYGDALATEDSYNQYAEGDVRREFITKGIRSSAENPAYLVNKYDNISTFNEHIKVIRLAEVYLTRAEALAKLGGANVTGALADLNLIRKRANPEAEDITLSGDALIAEILAERRRELAFEGHRLYDLTRNNLAFTHYISPLIVDRPNSFVVDYPGRSSQHLRTILPIPQQEIDNNVGLQGQQNEGY